MEKDAVEKKPRLVLGMRRWLAYAVIVFVSCMLLTVVAYVFNPRINVEKITQGAMGLTLAAALVGMMQDSRMRRRENKGDNPSGQ